MRTRPITVVWFLCLGVLLTLCACHAGDPQFTQQSPAGFWMGLWHGMISFITLVWALFNDSVHVYEVHNNGLWYDFGFLVGVSSFWGGGSHGYRRRERRRDDKEWEEIGKRVEAKLKRLISEWADAEPGEDWKIVEEKAEAKLKKKIREWADEP